MEYKVRPPRVGEAVAWESLRLASWRVAYATDFSDDVFALQEAHLERRAAGFAEWLAGTNGTGEDVQPQLGQKRRALVAVRTDADPGETDPLLGALLGLAFVSQMPHDVQKLEMLYLVPEAFGTGVAQDLMHHALEPGPAELEVLTTNARAIRFYEKEGFAVSHKDEFAGRKTYIMKRPAPQTQEETP